VINYNSNKKNKNKKIKNKKKKKVVEKINKLINKKE